MLVAPGKEDKDEVRLGKAVILDLLPWVVIAE